MITLLFKMLCIVSLQIMVGIYLISTNTLATASNDKDFQRFRSLKMIGRQLGQRFVKTPGNHTVRVGDRVRMSCIIENKVGKVCWTRNGLRLGTEEHLDATFDRYSIKPSKPAYKGSFVEDFSLEVYPVTLEDDAVFQCQVESWTEDSQDVQLISQAAKLTVEFPAMPPVIVDYVGNVLKTVDGKRERLECVSRRSKPPADVRWIDENGRFIKPGANLEESKQAIDDEYKVFDVRSIFHLVASKKHHNKTLACRAQNRPITKPMFALIRIEVSYVPIVDIEIQPAEIREFGNVSFSCKVLEANPPEIISYKWYIITTNEKQIIQVDQGSMYVINNVSRIYNEAKVRCESLNSIGWGRKTETLSVFYGPKFLNWVQDVHADVNQTITLYCNVDGNPKPEIVWHYVPMKMVVGYGSEFSTTISEQNQGKYACSAHVNGYSSISASTTVSIKGPPKISSNTVTYLADGGGANGNKAQTIVRLECVVTSLPLPVNVTWMRYGRQIYNNNSKYTISESNLQNGKITVLLFRQSQHQMGIGSFNCTAENAYGTTTLEFNFMSYKNSMKLIFILTCVTAILLLVVGMATIYFLVKRYTCF